MLFERTPPVSYGFMKPTPFFEGTVQAYRYADPKIKPGFFTPFSSVRQIKEQIKLPIAMPLLCLTAALKAAIYTFEELAIAALNLALFEFKAAKFHFSKACTGMLNIGSYLITGVIDFLWEAVALTSRTLATVVSLGVAAVDFAQDIFSSNAGENSQSKNAPSEDLTGFSDPKPFGSM